MLKVSKQLTHTFLSA